MTPCKSSHYKQFTYMYIYLMNINFIKSIFLISNTCTYKSKNSLRLQVALINLCDDVCFSFCRTLTTFHRPSASMLYTVCPRSNLTFISDIVEKIENHCVINPIISSSISECSITILAMHHFIRNTVTSHLRNATENRLKFKQVSGKNKC